MLRCGSAPRRAGQAATEASAGNSCYDADMKRTTVVLPDDLHVLLERERRRRDVSAAAIIREALAAYLGVSDQPRRLLFAALGRSGYHDTARRAKEILREEWGRADRR